MSDFFNSGWSIFVAAATVVGLLACLWLLFVASKRQPMAADNSTGHVFDEDLVEMNNPLPRWWMVLFVLTVVFAFVYVAVFPGLGSFAGQLGWTSTNQFEAEQQAAAREIAPIYAAFKDLPAADAEPQPEGDGDRRAPVHQQLRHLPRLGRARQQGIPEPDRHRLAATAARPRRSRRRSPRAASA